jgi:hypothetical protein
LLVTFSNKMFSVGFSETFRKKNMSRSDRFEFKRENEPNGASCIKIYGPQQGNSSWPNDRCINCGYLDSKPSTTTTIITETATNFQH